jgi:biotin-(acetyl-CoA carboxylase) ligase
LECVLIDFLILWQKLNSSIANVSLSGCCCCAGLNLDNDLPTLSVNQVVREHNAAHGSNLQPLSLEQTLAAIMNQFELLWTTFNAEGFHNSAVGNAYYLLWLHSNQEVTIEGFAGTFRITGVDEQGYLLVMNTATGETMSLESDGNSFDMSRNLVKRKM